MDEKKLETLMRTDFSVGTEAFRDTLLRQCLDVLESSDEQPGFPPMCEIDDEMLEMIAAAGDTASWERAIGVISHDL